MGIKDLPKTIKSTAGTKAVRQCKLEKLSGYTVAVDASLLIHKTVLAIRSNGQDLKNLDGELTSHLNGIFFKTIVFLENNITPVFVFDGTPPDIKNITTLKRKKIRDDANAKLSELSDSEDEEYIKNFRKTFRPTEDNMQQARILLGLMGIPYIDAPEEADPVCAWLAARRNSRGERYVKGVASDDSDMLPLGSPYLFKDMLGFIHKKPITIISLRKTLIGMDMSMEMFVELCVLSGTDCCERIHGIGPKRAMTLLKKHKTLSNVLKFIKKDRKISSSNDEIRSAFREQSKNMMAAKEYFMTALDKLDLDDDFNIEESDLEMRKFKKKELINFMCDKHGFDRNRIMSSINKLESIAEKMNITRTNTTPYEFVDGTNSLEILSNEDVSFLEDSESSEIVSKYTKKTRMIKKKNK